MNELEKLRHDLEIAKFIIKSMFENNEPMYRELHEKWIRRYFEDILDGDFTHHKVEFEFIH